VAFAREGILTGSLESGREALRSWAFVPLYSDAYRVTVLRLFGWKCCFPWAVAGSVGFVLFVSAPFQADSVCLRVLRQGLLIEQARSQSLRSPTFMNGSDLCGGTVR
jgi:hypothetical protein